MLRTGRLLFPVFLVLLFNLSDTQAFQGFEQSAYPGLPVIENKTTSIKFSIKKAPEGYRMTMENISDKNLLAVGIDKIVEEKRTPVYTALADVDHPLEPGKIVAVVSLSFVDAEKTKYVISAAYEDLTFEGEKDHLILVAGMWFGARLQARTIVYLFQKAIENADQNPDTALEYLQQQISALSHRADESEVKPLEKHLAPLTEAESEELKLRVNMGMSWLKSTVVSVIKQYKNDNSKKGISLKSWLADKKGWCEKRMRQISVPV